MSEPLSPALDPSTPDTSSAVPDPSAPPKASEASADSKVTLTTEIGMAHAETIIGNIFQFPSGVVSFSIDSAKEVTAELAQTTEELFVGEKRLIDEALADLAKQRILLLAGSPGSGRLTTAIYLAGRTATQHRLRSTLVVGALAQNVDVDIWKTAEDAKHFGRRTTIFSNALRHGNGELLRFFTTNGAVHWEQLTKTLTASEAYLIFTAEPGEIANFRPQCSEGLVCRDLTPLGSDLAGRGLDLRASWMHQRERLTDEQFRQITKNRETLRTTLKSLGQITRFLAQYEHSELAVEDALRRFNDIPFWFSTDLSRDVDAWCLATTLALASKAGQSSSAGWWELERIRRAVTEQIKEDRELFPERRSPDSQPGLGETRESKTSGQWLTDDALLLRARAEVVKDPSRLGDTVAFADRTYADAIWPALVARHRRVLTAILPALRSVVEDERGPGSYAVRSLAAQMIGMIGELDPFAISLPLVQRDWVDPRGGSQQLRPFVGRLVQGIRACRNRNYSLAALGALDTLIADDFGDGASTERMLTAISSYSLIGEQEMSLAMERLGRIATEYLAPVMANLQQVQTLVKKVDQHLSRTSSQQTADDLLNHRSRLGRLAGRLGAQYPARFLALRQAVVYLCVTNDPIPVLFAMREWVPNSNSDAGALVALLFLHGGIAEELETVAANVSALGGGERTNPILRSLANSDPAGERFSIFLADVYQSIHHASSLSGELQSELQDRFTMQLTEWARAALANPAHSDALQSLFVRLINIRNEALRHDILALIGSGPFVEERPMRVFAEGVRRRQMERNRGGQ